MPTKLKDEPIFVLAALCVFFPIGLVLLFRSELNTRFKWLLGSIGCVVFAGLLTLAVLNRPSPVNLEEIQVSVTRETLSVGQSGGFIVGSGNEYCTEFTVEAENDILSVSDNLYTAVKPGTCTLQICFEDQVRTVTICVQEGPGTDQIVLASPSAERYHQINAKHAGKHAVEMTEEEALQSGKTPCKTCFE